jgi:orotidine-5'-phosphate decarboxylase
LKFEDLVRTSLHNKQSRIVLALDLEIQNSQSLIEKCNQIVDDVKNYICAVKINRQLVLSLGLPAVTDIVKRAHSNSLPVIMDAKINDVGHTNTFMMRSYIQAGFDAVIASPVVGWEDGMDSVFKLASEHERGILLLIYMSNPGAERFYSMVADGYHGKAIFEVFAELAVQWKADGVVVGATRPQVVRRVRSIVGPKLAIYSPGVGVQGGDAREAVQAGATYLIVGRAIYASPKPAEAARALFDQAKYTCHQS